MDEHEAGTWLARDGDGRILEVDADGCPSADAAPGDGRPVAEAAEPGQWVPLASGLLMGPPRTGKTGWLARQMEAEAGS